MIRDRGPDAPTTRAELETAVTDLLYAAYENGVDVEREIAVRSPSTDVPDWSVEIVRLRKRW